MNDSQRLERAQAVMDRQGIDALLVGPGADLRYLVGYNALAMERLTLLVLPASGAATLIVPELEEPRARASGAADIAEVRTWKETEDPIDHVADTLGAAGGAYAVQDQLWSAFTLRLQERLGGTWNAGGEVMRALRTVKQPDEVGCLRRVGAAIDAVHARVPELLRPGRTETDVGRDITAMIEEDHDEAAFVIVASGPNAASPHHETGQRELREGDSVVVDIGGRLDGYCSDMTRTYVLGRASDDFVGLYDTLRRAQAAAVDAVAPGVAAESVDAAARSVIADAGYGGYFNHRTGHGIGIDVHEHPYIVAGNAEPLEAGMTFSVEPGIYVPGRHGARIEDIVAVTDTGVERLNTLGRDLVEVPA